MPSSSGSNPRSQSRSAASTVDRVLPNSLEAEMGLLGSALLSPTDVLSECIAIIGAESDHYYQHAHKVIFDQLREMYQRNEAVDPVTLTQRLKDNNRLDEVGGPIYVTNLFTSVPTAGNFKYYLNIVREKYLLRRLIEASTQIVTKCYEEQENVEGLLDEAERSVFSICDKGVTDDAKTMAKIIPDVFTTIEKLYNNRGSLTGLSSGFRDYDKLTSGLHEGEMVILAARPGVGKTAFALNMAENVAIEQGKAVGVFSLEMSAESLVMRMLCARARVDSHKVRSGFLGKGDFTPLTNAASELIKAPIFIDDSANLSILHLRAKARRLKANQQVRLLIVDYLQLVTDENARGNDGRQAEVAAVSRQLKALSKELQVPIVVLCQLNREIEKRGDDARPRLADLRESGSIEQDADVVAFLTRKSDSEGTFSQTGESELVISKQRNGPTGDVSLVFKGEYTRFFDAAKTTDEDVQEIRGNTE